MVIESRGRRFILTVQPPESRKTKRRYRENGGIFLKIASQWEWPLPVFYSTRFCKAEAMCFGCPFSYSWALIEFSLIASLDRDTADQ